MISLTPGRITALWLVLRSVEKLGGESSRSDLMRVASRSSLRSGGLPISDGLQLGLRGKFVRQSGEHLSLTEFGRGVLALAAEDEPPQEARRVFLSVLLLSDPPPWVAYWQGDPTSIGLLLSDADRSILAGAGLWPTPAADSADLQVAAWWDALAIVPLPESVLALKKAVGDAGEQLTIRYEQERLRAEGHSDLAERVWWAGRESPAYGFDVGTFRGRSFGGDPAEPLAIEVKSVAYPVQEVFPFHLTVHEWRTAQRLKGRHVLHLWENVRVSAEQPPVPRTPRIVSADSIRDHIALPPTCGHRCCWESMAIDFPITD